MRLFKIVLMVVFVAGGLMVEAEGDAGAATIRAHHHASRHAKRKHRKHRRKRHRRHGTHAPPPATEM